MSFNDREAAFEGKFAHDSKMDFETEAKVSKTFGLWVAEQLGLSGADAQTYAASVVEANLEEPGFDDVIRKVRADIDKKELDISDHMLNVQLEKAFDAVRRAAEG